MPLKRQLTHLKETRKLAKSRIIENKSNILVKNISFLLKDKHIKDFQIFKKDILYHKIFDRGENSDFKNNIEMIDDD